MSALDSKVVDQSPKEQVKTLLGRLPDNCTFEDVQYGLYVLETIRKGKEEIDRGETVRTRKSNAGLSNGSQNSLDEYLASLT